MACTLLGVQCAQAMVRGTWDQQRAPSRSDSFQRENMEPVLDAVGLDFSASTPTVTQDSASLPHCSLQH